MLLIGNYPRDQQESMQRFSRSMRAGLERTDIQTELLQPEAYFGRFGASSLSGIGKWLAYLDKMVLFPLILRHHLSTLKRRHPNDEIIVHICDHSNAIYTKYLVGVPHLVTCHDLLAVRSAQGEISENPTRWSGRRLQEMIVEGMKRSRLIVCDSKATQKDVLRVINPRDGRVSMIHIALNYPYSPMPLREARNRVEALCAKAGAGDLTDDFLLHVGGNQWYKNRPGVLRIHSLLPQAQPLSWLIFVGKPPSLKMKSLLAKHPAKQRVVFIESCDNEDLRALYSTAQALIFPSLAEGFGWPVVEAQACGCPVICSSIAPLTEVAGEGAILCDANNDLTFVKAIELLSSQGDLRSRLVQRGFSNVERFRPIRMIAEYLEAYRTL